MRNHPRIQHPPHLITPHHKSIHITPARSPRRNNMRQKTSPKTPTLKQHPQRRKMITLSHPRPAQNNKQKNRNILQQPAQRSHLRPAAIRIRQTPPKMPGHRHQSRPHTQPLQRRIQRIRLKHPPIITVQRMRHQTNLLRLHHQKNSRAPTRQAAGEQRNRNRLA